MVSKKIQWFKKTRRYRRDQKRSSHKNHAIKVLPPDAKLSKAVRFSKHLLGAQRTGRGKSLAVPRKA